jgi:hypothetical protein
MATHTQLGYYHGFGQVLGGRFSTGDTSFSFLSKKELDPEPGR